MTTSQSTTNPAREAPAPADATRDQAAAPAARPSLRLTVSQTFTLAWRAIKKMQRTPEQFSDVLLQPVLFTLLFAYIFGGAIAGDVSSYLPLMIPGLLAMTTLTACMATGTQLREDMDTGVFNRFRALPLARIVPLIGPMVADLLRYAVAAGLTVAMGLLLGYRPGGGTFGVLAALALTIATGWSLSWAFAYLGTIARSAQSVQGLSMLLLFPLTFLSNAFVPVETLPNWLAEFVRFNPVSHVISAIRDLANDGAVTGEVGWALIGCVVVVATFAPLAVHRYQRIS